MDLRKKFDSFDSIGGRDVVPRGVRSRQYVVKLQSENSFDLVELFNTSIYHERPTYHHRHHSQEQQQHFLLLSRKIGYDQKQKRQ